MFVWFIAAQSNCVFNSYTHVFLPAPTIILLLKPYRLQCAVQTKRNKNVDGIKFYVVITKYFSYKHNEK